MAKIVLIDPGHGGKFSGAVHKEVREKDITLRAAGYLRKSLERKNIGAFLTREVDLHFASGLTDDLQARAEVEHILDPDCFVSIHCNSYSDPGAHGFEVFTTEGETDSDELAERILERVQKDFPTIRIRADLSDGDLDREAYFYVLRKTWGPAVLAELGFISNPSERARLTDDASLRDLMETIAEGVVEWLG